MSIDRRLLLLGLAGAGGALVSGCGGGEYVSRMPRPMTSGDDRVRPVGPAAFPEVAFADWVDGEVRTPGVIEMTGDLDAHQAVIQAGGFLPTARQQEVALMRRGRGGVRMMRAIDLRPRRGEVVALPRGDIIFVPRSNLGEVANFVSLFRNALPIGFSYAIGGQYQQF